MVRQLRWAMLRFCPPYLTRAGPGPPGADHLSASQRNYPAALVTSDSGALQQERAVLVIKTKHIAVIIDVENVT